MKPVGEYTIQKGNFCIDYTVEDESFDHAFGRHRQFGYVIDKVDFYVEEVNNWINITSLLTRYNFLSRHVDSIVDADMEDF